MPSGRSTTTKMIAINVVAARRMSVFTAMGRLTWVAPDAFSLEAVDITRRMFDQAEAEADARAKAGERPADEREHHERDDADAERGEDRPPEHPRDLRQVKLFQYRCESVHALILDGSEDSSVSDPSRGRPRCWLSEKRLDLEIDRRKPRRPARSPIQQR